MALVENEVETVEWKVRTKSEQETLTLATITGQKAQKGEVILLAGDLGAGKTVFAKGLAKGLQITEVVNSPTFNIVKCYFKGSLPFFHIDAYRLEGNKQDLGLDEYIYGEGLCVIEWPDYIDYLLPNEFLKIAIGRISDNVRELHFMAQGQQSEMLLEGVKTQWQQY